MHKPFIYLFISITLFAFSSCRPSNSLVNFSGQTMGTYYRISYLSPKAQNHQVSIDSLLIAYNNALSTYIPTSIISRFNTAQANTPIAINAYVKTVFQEATKVYKASEGAFDPTVMPLVNAWGFGYKDGLSIDSTSIDSLKQLVDFDAVKITKEGSQFFLIKTKPGLQLDFSAIAKGHAVDVLGNFLDSQQIGNYLIDIGGELKAKGKNKHEKWWTVGIDKPQENAQERALEAIINLENRAIATSGNYRNFYTKNGQKYAHTINPKTGYPKLSDLLSVSVFAPNCITADAYATAFMVMGYEKAKKTILQNKNLDALFIYSKPDGSIAKDMTQGVSFTN